MADDMVMGWDDTFEAGAGRSPFTLLAKGVYSFTVTDMKKGQYTPKGSSKIPACPKAELTMRFDGGAQGSTTIAENFYLIQSQAWKMSDFFVCLGIDPDDGKYSPRCFKDIKGKSGIADVDVREYIGNDGEKKKTNQVKTYLAPGSAKVGPLETISSTDNTADAKAAVTSDGDDW